MRRNDRSRRYHDRVARQYDAMYDDPYWRFHDELTWRAIKPNLPRNANAPCVDLGCGTGKWGLRILKSGYPVTFLDHSSKMIEQARQNVESLGAKSKHATFQVADIVDLSSLPPAHFALAVAMGDPLSICSDPRRAATEIARIMQPHGLVIATADNKLAALDHFFAANDMDGLEQFVRTGKTTWLTSDEREQFELSTFTPESLRRLFEGAGFEVLEIIGKTILPVRTNRKVLDEPDAVDRLLRLEQQLARDPSACARAGHLHITARRSD